MRKLAALLIMAMLLALPLAGCDMDIVSTPGTTLSGHESPSIDYDAMSEEDAKVRRVADQAVMKEYGLTDLSIFKISVSDYESEYRVRYWLKIQNFSSDERYSVDLSKDCAVVNIKCENRGVYSRYLECATEELVKAAEEKIEAKIKESTKGDDYDPRYHLCIDDEGNLLLTCEAIVNFSTVVTNGYGGCGKIGERNPHLPGGLSLSVGKLL